MGSGQGSLRCPECGKRELRRTGRGRYIRRVKGWLVREYRCRGCGRLWVTAQTPERIVTSDEMRTLVKGRRPPMPRGIAASYSSARTTDAPTDDEQHED